MSSIIYNGHEIQDLIVNGNQAQLWLNGQKLYPSAEPGPVDPYNPLGLPPFTIRCKFSSGYTPTMGDSQTLVDAVENVWDITKNDTSWNRLFRTAIGEKSYLVSVLGANTTGVTYMEGMFWNCNKFTTVQLFDTSSCTSMANMFGRCSSLTTVPLFDTSSCTAIYGAFSSCTSLTTVPLFDTSSVTAMNDMFSDCTSLTTVPLFDTRSCRVMTWMFQNCYNVQSGALALYQQASTQATPPSSYGNCFKDCGKNTVTGAAELAQIPTSWGGTMA